MQRFYYDSTGQRARRKELYDIFTKTWLNSFDETGRWKEREDLKPARQFEKLGFCLPFLGSGNVNAIKEANAIIKGTCLNFCHFSPIQSLILLKEYSELLEEKSKTVLTNYISGILEEFKEGDLDFVGVNDNFPCISTYITLIGGKMLNRRDIYETGVKRLKQLEAIFKRRGVLTEYNSPTYTPIQLQAVAAIANHVEDMELKSIALKCEERMWIDLLGHYYPEIGQLTGPFSRAYTSGSAGPGMMRPILYIIFGNGMPIHPAEGFTGEAKIPAIAADITGLGMHQRFAEHINTEFHCPEYLARWALNREYPFSFKATTEFNSSNDDLPNGLRRGHHDGKPEPDIRNPYEEDEVYEYASGTGVISTYMTEDYSIGASTREFHNGQQTESFFIAYAKNKPVRDQKDIATVYARYVFDDRRPGQENEYPELGMKNGKSLLCDEGRKLVLHHEKTAMVLYKPKAYGYDNISSMKLMLVFPTKDEVLDEIWLGDRKVSENYFESTEPCPIYIRNGNVYMAFYPLILTNYGRKKAVCVERVNGFTTISLYNYEGACREFKRRGFLLTGNGFVTEVSSKREAGTFESFRNSMKAVKISDSLLTNPHIRQTYVRNTVYSRKGITLECEWSPVSEGIRYMTVNGFASDNPKLEASGLDISKVPYMKW